MRRIRQRHLAVILVLHVQILFCPAHCCCEVITPCVCFVFPVAFDLPRRQRVVGCGNSGSTIVYGYRDSPQVVGIGRMLLWRKSCAVGDQHIFLKEDVLVRTASDRHDRVDGESVGHEGQLGDALTVLVCLALLSRKKLGSRGSKVHDLQIVLRLIRNVHQGNVYRNLRLWLHLVVIRPNLNIKEARIGRIGSSLCGCRLYLIGFLRNLWKCLGRILRSVYVSRLLSCILLASLLHSLLEIACECRIVCGYLARTQPRVIGYFGFGPVGNGDFVVCTVGGDDMSGDLLVRNGNREDFSVGHRNPERLVAGKRTQAHQSPVAGSNRLRVDCRNIILSQVRTGFALEVVLQLQPTERGVGLRLANPYEVGV